MWHDEFCFHPATLLQVFFCLHSDFDAKGKIDAAVILVEFKRAIAEIKGMAGGTVVSV